jgi:two-component system OmpR family response regulator
MLGAGGLGMRVLVIEDDAKLLESVRKGLKESGYGADGASDGREGLRQALDEEYDAVVLDLMLPGLSGLEVLRELREHRRATPVLVLSARSSVEDRVKGLDLGADDYLAKPFSFQELEARLRAITRRPAVEPATVLSAGDLTVDIVRHQARRSGRLLDLTAKEFSLLEYLTRRKDVVLTRAMILDHVWDLDYDGGSNLVEVYINYLRKKVDAGHEVKLIQTVRGTGYVLREPR